MFPTLFRFFFLLFLPFSFGLSAVNMLAQSVTYIPAPWISSMPGNHISALARGSGGELLVGTTQGGLYRLAGSQWDIIPLEFTNFTSQIQCLHVDQDGVIWVGTSEGLAAIAPHLPMNNVHQSTFSNIREPIFSIEKGPFQSLWIEGKENHFLWVNKQLFPISDSLLPKVVDEVTRFVQSPNPLHFTTRSLPLDSLVQWWKSKTNIRNNVGFKRWLGVPLEHGWYAEAAPQGVWIGEAAQCVPFRSGFMVKSLPMVVPTQTERRRELDAGAPFYSSMLNRLIQPGALTLLEIEGAHHYYFNRNQSIIHCAPGTTALKMKFGAIYPMPEGYHFLNHRLEDDAAFETHFLDEPLHIKELRPGIQALQVYFLDLDGRRSPSYWYTLQVYPEWYETPGLQVAVSVLFFSILLWFAVEWRIRRGRAHRQAKQLRDHVQALSVDHIRHVLPAHLVGNAVQHLQGLLIQKNHTLASAYMEHVQDLFHFALNNTMRTISLAEELDFIRFYFEVENQRLGLKNKLHIVVESDLDTSRYQIPAMLTQPIMENAFKYAFSTSHPGQVFWEVKKQGPQILLICTCVSTRVLPETRLARGKGLLLVKEQLVCFFPPPAKVSVHAHQEGDHSFKTEILFPCVEDSF